MKYALETNFLCWSWFSPRVGITWARFPAYTLTNLNVIKKKKRPERYELLKVEHVNLKKKNIYIFPHKAFLNV